MARIAVLEDSPLMQGVLKRVLEAAGYEVLLWEPTSALEISERVTADAPDLLLTDYQMPGVNGLTVLKLAKKAKPGLPVVLLTSLREEQVHFQLEKAGADRILVKPAEGSLILQTLRELLEGAS